ncbi:MAG: YfhO family protein [Candidatus Cloacimonetes bacterium]|nr:YfhO family protein [Candidatus Cloacimonadota bacterium]
MAAKNVNQKIKQNIRKSTKQSTSATKTPEVKTPSAFSKHLPWVLVVILFLLLSLVYFPVAYQGKAPQASDITQWQGAAKAIIDYNATHKDNALWTPYMFSGMPTYMISFPNRYPFLESITKLTDKIINWRIFLLFIGGLGIFLLLRQLKMDPWIAFFAAISFTFSCHWVGLLDIGHNTKFRAIMYIPWVVWALFRLKEKPNMLNLGLLATFLITQLRENHPQITYYLYLFIGMFWIYALIEAIKDKQYKKLGNWTLLLIIAFVLTALAVMNPYLSTWEYSHYTMRGGSAGLEKSYAQAWSFPPLEIIALLIPNFFGGINEYYWGAMPFTQIYNYFGIVVLALGVIALFGKHKKFSLFLWIASAIFMLLSFGSFTPVLSDFFFKYLPMFNKFRVPSMTLIMVQFIAVILAALGLDTIATLNNNSRWQKNLFTAFWVSGAVFFLFLILGKSIFSGLPFTNAEEIARYQTKNALAQLESLKTMRLNMLYKSGIMSLLLLTVSFGICYLASAKKLKTVALVMLITLISFIDLYIYTGKHLKDLYPAEEREARFVAQDFDQFLLEDKDNYRIYPFNMGRVRTAGEWAYYHQTIDGYSAAKLKRYDDIWKLIQGDAKNDGEFLRYLIGVYEKGGIETPTPILDMLATRYIVFPDSLPYASFLTKIRPVFSSYTGANIYQNLTAYPRAWFVDSLSVIPDIKTRLENMQDLSFNPRSLAIVETKIDGVSKPDSCFAKETFFDMHNVKYDVGTDKDAFLVVSEIYYPAGWKAFIDGKETEIYPVNHILRGVKIPAGKHTLEMKFISETYRLSLILSLSGILLTVILTVVGFAWEEKNKKRKINEIV